VKPLVIAGKDYIQEKKGGEGRRGEDRVACATEKEEGLVGESSRKKGEKVPTGTRVPKLHRRRRG